MTRQNNAPDDFAMLVRSTTQYKIPEEGHLTVVSGVILPEDLALSIASQWAAAARAFRETGQTVPKKGLYFPDFLELSFGLEIPVDKTGIRVGMALTQERLLCTFGMAALEKSFPEWGVAALIDGFCTAVEAAQWQK